MYSKKINRIDVEPSPISDVPSSYLYNHNQITKEDKGLRKLRDRNDTIYSDLCEFAKRNGTKVLVCKFDDMICYTVKDFDIKITLINDAPKRIG